jgi:uncharacterized protein (TIGR03437 family)
LCFIDLVDRLLHSPLNNLYKYKIIASFRRIFRLEKCKPKMVMDFPLNRRNIIAALRFAPTILLCAISLNGQVSVLTYHNDLSRTGQNLNETILTPTRVSSGQFGKLFSEAVDGQVYAQPLYMAAVNIPGKGLHNVVFVATEHDSVYAFDADRDAAAPLWHANFTNFALGVTAAPADSLACNVIMPEVGITGTPVIDPATGTLYVVAMTLEQFGQTYVQRLHALDVATGAEKPGSPVEIQASMAGTGDGNTMVRFNPRFYKQRSGLLLLNGVVYTAWSSHCDAGNYHGWVVGYNAETLQQVSVYTSTPNWYAGSFWQGGAAPAADADGNIYVVSGNGTFDADRGGSDLGESIIKLSTIPGLSVADYFTPFNADLLSEKDMDLGSSGALLLPDAAGTPAHPHLLVSGSKEGRIYVLDRDKMGHFQPGSDSQIVQSLPAAVGPVFGIPVYFNNTVYFAGKGDVVKAFSISNGLLSEKPVSQSVGPVPYLGLVPSISANGSTNGILWTIDSSAQLHAFDALNLRNELYHASVGSYVKFSTPTIANGKVYVGTMNSLVVFGLLNSGAGTVDSIVNAAGFQPGPVAPGSIVSVFGSKLAPSVASAQTLPLPTSLEGTSIRVNGVPSPLYYVSPTQVNAQIPYEVSTGPATVILSIGANVLPPVALTIQPSAPGLFLLGQNRALVQNQDGSINGPGHPATPGSIVTAYLTGQGPLDLPVPSGSAAPPDPLIGAAAQVTATLGGQTGEVTFAGMTPGLVGVFQVNLRIPALAPGDYPLAVAVGRAMSNAALISVGG